MTPSQQRAIDTNASAVLVVAGAGSGKTTVVTHRIARLVNSGVSPESFLVLTFTRKAAKELRERLAGLIGESTSRKIWKESGSSENTRNPQKSPYLTAVMRLMAEW